MNLIKAQSSSELTDKWINVHHITSLDGYRQQDGTWRLSATMLGNGYVCLLYSATKGEYDRLIDQIVMAVNKPTKVEVAA